MTYFRAAAALIAVGAATPAFADLTAEDVWESLVASGESLGETINGTPSKSGKVLTVENVTVAIDTSEGNISGFLGDLQFSERADGSVKIDLDDEFSLKINMQPVDAPSPFRMTMTFTQSGADIVASGSPAEITYDYSIASSAGQITELEFPEEDVELDMTMIFELVDAAGQYVISDGMKRRIVESGTVAKLDATIFGEMPEEDSKFSFAFTASDLTTKSESSMAKSGETSDLAAMLKSGFESKGSVASGPTSFAMEFAGPEGQGKFDYAVETSDFAYDIGDDSIAYDVLSKGIEMEVQSPEIPLPELSATLRESAFAIAMPVMATDEPRDLRILTTLRDLQISDVIWNLFDPAGQLPRDPATLVIDLSGAGRWLVDIFDPEVSENLTGMPGEVYEANLHDIELTAAGASLTGSGAFTFDNSDFLTFPGSPRPEGTLNLRLSGANTLMDTLVAMGLLPQDQVMGARMMLGLFARPGAGEDVLESEITVTPDGQVLANGQRLR